MIESFHTDPSEVMMKRRLLEMRTYIPVLGTVTD